MGFNSGIRLNGFISLVLGSTMFGIGAWTCWVYSRSVIPEQYTTVKCNFQGAQSSYSTYPSSDLPEIKVMLQEKCKATEDIIESSLLRHSIWILCLSLTQILSASLVLPSLTNEVAITEAKHWILMQCLILCSYCLSFASQVSSIERVNHLGMEFMDSYHLAMLPDYIYSFLWSIQLVIVLGFINVFLGGIFIVCHLCQTQNRRSQDSAIIKV